MLNNNFLFYVFVGNLLIILYNMFVTKEIGGQNGLQIFSLCFLIFWNYDLKTYLVILGKEFSELYLKTNLTTIP